MITREDVYFVIDEERNRQDEIWGGAPHDSQHETGSWITYMRVYLRKAEDELAGKNFDHKKAVKNIKKAVALGVACMEYQYEE
jgi:hypothetical protein